MVHDCDRKTLHCQFNIEKGSHFEIGESFFKDHYTIFDMDKQSLLVGVSNKYPEEWLSTVCLVRMGLGMLILMVVTACVLQSPNYAKLMRRRRDEVEGIELITKDISRCELNEALD